MKVLLSAYACEPGLGSEPEVGLQTALIAARYHDVWLLTRANHAARLREVLNADPAGCRIRVHPIDQPGLAASLKKRLGTVGMYAYYSVWQREAGRQARRLHSEVGFDLAHHVTFANYWSPVGVATLDVPLVWGPIGGGLSPPWRLATEMGLRGIAAAILRATLRPMAAIFASRARRNADVILVQNAATERRLAGRTEAQIRVAPNALVAARGTGESSGAVDVSADIVVVGRLIPWKAAKLALRCLRELAHPSARLVFLGSGPEAERIRTTAAAWGLSERVVLAGRVPRAETLVRVREAAALLHPALHEEAGLAVAEALAVGTPVVTLDHGGPAELVRLWPDSPADLVSPATPTLTARRCARALERHLKGCEGSSPRQPIAPRLTYENAILSSYVSAVGKEPGLEVGEDERFGAAARAFSSQ